MAPYLCSEQQRPLAVFASGKHVDFDLCFQQAVLAPILAGLLVLLMVSRIVSLVHRPTPRTALPDSGNWKWGLLCGVKTLVTALNVALAGLYLVDATQRGTALGSELIGQVSLGVTLVVTLGLQLAEHSRGGSTSSVRLCTVFLTALVWQLMRFRTLYLNNAETLALEPNFLSISLGHVALTGLALLVEGFSGNRVDKSATSILGEDFDFAASPEQSASLFSQMSYAWVVPMLRLARSKVLTKGDLWSIPSKIGSHRNGEFLKREWAREARSTPEQPSFVKVLVKTFLPPYLPLLLATAITTCIGFLRPAFIGFFVTFVSSRGTANAIPTSDGLVMAGVFLFFNVMQLIVDHNVGFRVSKLNLSIQSAVRMLVYEKMLRLPSHRQTKIGESDDDDTDNTTDLGKIVTMIESDADQLVTPLGWSMEMFSSPIIFVVAIVLLYGQVGWLCVLPPVIIIGSSPVLGRVADRMQRHTKRTQEHAGKRTKLLSDTIGHMLGFKLYGWVQVMAERILVEREKELESRRCGLRIYSFQLGLSEAVPALSTFSVFLVYAFVAAPGELTVAKVFTTLSIIGMLDHPITGLMYGWYPYVEAYASGGRIAKFLLSEERVDYVQRFPLTSDLTETQPLLTDTNAGISPAPWTVRIANGQFSFTNDADRVTLRVPSLTFARGTRTAVIGSVGDGKSALLAAILGEIDCLSGTVSVRCNSIAYVGQQPWVFHTSVQDNIRFGLPLDQDKYQQAIDACALRSDLDGFLQGDQQLIGDKGQQLSGGQKARLTLARAVYAVLMGAADLVLLDDPLSSVDAHVERHIFDRLFAPKTGLLAGKTVIMVTNGLHHIPSFDAVVLVRQGAIIESGLYETVMARAEGHVRKLMDQYMVKRIGSKLAVVSDSGKNIDDEITAASETELAGEAETAGASVKDSEASDAGESSEGDGHSGSVSLKVYKAYLAHCGIGYFTVLVFLEALSQASKLLMTIWLGFWGSSVANADFNLPVFAGVYTSIVASSVLFAIVTAYYGLAVVGLRAGKTTQAKMLHAVFAAPMSFFNSTSAGHVLQRFTNDQRAVDVRMPDTTHNLLTQAFGLLGTIITITIATPWFLLLVIPSPFLFKLVQNVYLAASREVERIAAVLTSPVLQHLSESVEGIVTLRACGHTERFTYDAAVKFDCSAVAEYNSVALSGWRNLAQELMGTTLISCLAFLIVLTPTANASFVGVALLQSFGILWQLSSTFNCMSAIENTLVSLERINSYTQIEPEVNGAGAFKFGKGEWPLNGEIQFGGFSTRYSQESPLVLDRLNLKIAAGSKVAIVGRTGSGKTTTALSLFRIIEATSGSIQIDGVDIAQVDLHTLRSRLTILPQDPTIFTASVRENLDPFGTCSDADLWRALDLSTLGDHIRALGNNDNGSGNAGLDAELTPNSLSAGQAQLFALSRAMLRKSKVLVCDEATAKLDSASDAVVQRAIREQFAQQTVVTIAHRIDTIMDYDAVVVLSEGQVVEVGKPSELCRDDKSLFAGLAKQSGLVA